MRTLARAAIIVVLLGFSAVPLLHGGKPPGGKLGLSTALVPRFATKVNHWIPRIRMSEPAVLLVLGMGLIISAGVVPGLVRGRMRLGHIEPADFEAEKISPPEEAPIESNTLLQVQSPAHPHAQWPGERRASDGTFG